MGQLPKAWQEQPLVQFGWRLFSPGEQGELLLFVEREWGLVTPFSSSLTLCLGSPAGRCGQGRQGSQGSIPAGLSLEEDGCISAGEAAEPSG